MKKAVVLCFAIAVLRSSCGQLAARQRRCGPTVMSAHRPG